ncbi:MAG: ArdC family protein [Saprospiraceae bacterium]
MKSVRNLGGKHGVVMDWLEILQTGHIYTGINFLMNNTNHPIPYFMTFNQVKELNGQIKKGAKAEMVIYFTVYYKDSNDNTIERQEAIKRRQNGEDI